MNYWQPLLGGVLLGLSAFLLLLFNGRIAGISGISSGLLKNAKDWWRWCFVLGLIFSGFISAHWLGVPTIHASFPTLALAGLLVGFGSRIGNGCTSGHGICGMGRLSKRSMLAVGIFMLTAIITTFIRLHLIA